MKKIIGFAVTVFTVATLFAAARPSLDGRAIVADAGTMPKGLFARTIGYLPGDSVAVTNPATGSTVDVLILGAIDPGEGVAILLSPEAAEKLNIKQDSNVQVKITKRAGSLDEAVSGTAILADSDEPYTDEAEDGIEEIGGETAAIADVPTEPEPSVPTAPSVAPAVALSEPSAEEPSADAEVPADPEPIAPASEVAQAPVTIKSLLEAETPVAEEPSTEEPLAPISDTVSPVAVAVATDPEPIAEPVQITEPVAEPHEDTAPETVVSEILVPEPSVPPVPETAVAETTAPVHKAGVQTLPEGFDITQTDRIVFIEKPGKPAGDDDEIPAADEVSDEYLNELAELVKPSAESTEPVSVENPAPEVVAADDEAVLAERFSDTAPIVAEDVVVEYVDDIPPVVAEADAEKFTLDDNLLAESERAEDVPVDADTEAEPLVVIEPAAEVAAVEDEPAVAPADDTPLSEVSAVSASVAEVADGAYQPIILVPADENPPVADLTEGAEEDYIVLEPVASVASTAPIDVAPAPSVSESAALPAATTDNYLVPTLQDLTSNAYYVQIASLGDKENVDALLATYAERYPMAVVPLKSGRAYQVMVGPLGTDEYATVQERFKAYGFKDAFLRKIR